MLITSMRGFKVIHWITSNIPCALHRPPGLVKGVLPEGLPSVCVVEVGPAFPRNMFPSPADRTRNNDIKGKEKHHEVIECVLHS